MELKKTLNLPKTNFSMRANLVQREPVWLKKWEKDKLYQKIIAKRKTQGAKRYVLHDGPPFANGDVHMGTALNKILKDLVVKSYSMLGYETPFVPGWDCHGLPIEFKVVKESNNQDALKIRKECEAYAKKYIDIQRKTFRRLGIFGDWENPYITMNATYEANILRSFASFVKSGLVYRSLKPVLWSYGAKTALAEAEIEYKDKVSPAIFVKFAFLESKNERFAKLAANFVIWTTTPWTLPANVAIALHPNFTYEVHDFEINGKIERLLIGKNLLNYFCEKTGLESKKVLASFKGNELFDSEAEHPFLKRKVKVICEDFVTAETGSGAVHIAPGHGQDDYIAGLKNNLQIISPVDDDGLFSENVGLDELVDRKSVV